MFITITCPDLLMLSIILLSFFFMDKTLAASSEQVYYFNQCHNVTRAMVYQTDFENSIIRGDLNIPLDFGCGHVLFDSNLLLDPSTGKLGDLIFHGSKLPLSDICTNVRQWEVSLQVSCEEMLCGNVTSSRNSLGMFVSEMTQHNTTVQDWINYCQYCSADNVMFKKRVKSNNCLTNDDTIQRAIDNFPNSLQYCGFETFSLPLLTLDNYFICACEGYFAYKCFSKTVQYQNSSSIIIAGVLSSTLIFTLFFAFIPKVYCSLKKRKIFDIFPLTYTMVFSCLFITESALKNQVQEEITSILKGGFYTCLLLSISAWISNWYRIVRKISNITSLRINIMLYISQFLIIVILSFIIPSGLIIYYPKQGFQFYGVVSVAFSIVSACLFLGTSIWINKKLKLLSDVNIYESSLYKLVGFTVILLILHSLLSFTFLITDDKEIIFLSDSVLVIISYGIVYAEFDKDMTHEFYSNCCRTRNKAGKEYDSLSENDSNDSKPILTSDVPSTPNNFE